MSDKGLDIPVRSEQGRAVVVDGTRKLANDVILACSPGFSTNPFARDVGLSASVFQSHAPAFRALLQTEVEAHFARLRNDDRGRLMGLRFAEGDPGVLDLEVRYVDLETDDEDVLRRSFRRS